MFSFVSVPEVDRVVLISLSNPRVIPVHNVLRRTCMNFFNEMTTVIYLYQ